MVYDNSPGNLSNPDAQALVRFGEQTWEEMLYGGVSFRYANKADDVREINKQEYVTSLSMGFMDKNLDGRIELNEMPERARQRLAMAFMLLDKDKTGGLEFVEFHELMNTQRQRPGPGQAPAPQ
jgi:Ca2+-binding EF-hand superfamily protein